MLLLERPFQWNHSCETSDAEGWWWPGGAQDWLSGSQMHEQQAQREL